MKTEGIDDDLPPISDKDDTDEEYIPVGKTDRVLSQDDKIQEEENEDGAGYMEQEQIIIKKGKKLKQQKLIKLRDYDIKQPDYCLTPGGVLVYH